MCSVVELLQNNVSFICSDNLALIQRYPELGIMKQTLTTMLMLSNCCFHFCVGGWCVCVCVCVIELKLHWFDYLVCWSTVDHYFTERCYKPEDYRKDVLVFVVGCDRWKAAKWFMSLKRILWYQTTKFFWTGKSDVACKAANVWLRCHKYATEAPQPCVPWRNTEDNSYSGPWELTNQSRRGFLVVGS